MFHISCSFVGLSFGFIRRPVMAIILTPRRKSLSVGLLIIFVILSLLFVVFPIVFSKSKSLQRNAVFLSFITYPKNLNYSDPSRIGLYGTRNFKIRVKNDGVHIGVWHVLPRYMVKYFVEQLQIDENEFDDLRNALKIKNDDLDTVETTLKTTFPVVNGNNEEAFYENLLNVPGAIIIYLHGNTGSRGSGHRVDIYKLLRNLGYHVLTLDYRSYGDSDAVPPTEEGVVRDVMAVYEYVRNITANPIFVWGHSLGTGIATRMLYEADNVNANTPRGLILESPFTSLDDEIRVHPLGRFFRNLPWFDACIAEPLYKNNLRFESNVYISGIKQPILILHAEDDCVVPFALGYKLYRIALEDRKSTWGPIQIHRFNGAMHLGHKYACRAPELPILVQQFVETYRNELF